MPLYTPTITHSHTLTITCTCCYDEIKGIQDQHFSCSFSESLSPSVAGVVAQCHSCMCAQGEQAPRCCSNFFSQIPAVIMICLMNVQEGVPYGSCCLALPVSLSNSLPLTASLSLLSTVYISLHTHNHTLTHTPYHLYLLL